MQRLALDWYEVKLFVRHAGDVSMDALHVIAGVVLLFVIAFLLRTSVARPRPLLIVLILEIVNEASDFRVEIWPHLGMQAGEAAKDVLLTMALPTVIFLTARFRPNLFRYKSN